MPEENKDRPDHIPSDRELEKRLLNKNPQVFDGLSDEKKQQIIDALKDTISVKIKQEITRVKSSPIPFPEDLKGYYDIDKEYADIILKMSQEDQKYSHSRDDKIIEKHYQIEKKGQIFALIVSVLAITGGVICITMGYQIVGTIVSGFGLSGLVSKFLEKKTSDDNNRNFPE